MTETWLKPNRRALLFGTILPALAALGGAYLMWAVPDKPALAAIGAVFAAGGLTLDLLLLRQLVRPRLGFRRDKLLVYLGGGTPHVVPIEIVECFFLGQAAASVPMQRQRETTVSSVVIRLAESAHQFKRREVKPALGRWCDGYITIYGTWCEPLDLEAINRLNERLRAAKCKRNST